MISSGVSVIRILGTRAELTRRGLALDLRDARLTIELSGNVTLSIAGSGWSCDLLRLIGVDSCVEGRYPYLKIPGPRICIDPADDTWCENFDVVMAESMIASARDRRPCLLHRSRGHGYDGAGRPSGPSPRP